MCKHDINPLQCILPPHMLETISKRGDKKQKKMADELLKQSKDYRVEREQAAPADSFMAAPRVAAAAPPTVTRKIYDGEKKAGLPGKLVRSENDPASTDDAVNAAYDGAGAVYDLYLNEYERDSLDGNGMTLVSTVHHRRNYNNAFWNGEQMAYGDGDSVVFTNMTELSIVGHELSHGVVQFSGGLEYQNQSGALNESFADVFGALTVQHQLGNLLQRQTG